MPTDIAAVLADFLAGKVTLAEANALLFVAPIDPSLTCATCQFLHNALCERPGQPAQPMHPSSVRCSKYDRRDERADALPVTLKHNGLMFK